MWPNCKGQSNGETLIPYSPKTAFSCLREPAVAFSGSAKHSVPHDAKKLGFQTGIFIARLQRTVSRKNESVYR